MAKAKRYTGKSAAAVPNTARSGFFPTPMMKPGAQQKGAPKGKGK